MRLTPDRTRSATLIPVLYPDGGKTGRLEPPCEMNARSVLRRRPPPIDTRRTATRRARGAGKIADLFAIEADIRGRCPADRREAHQCRLY